MSNGALSTQRTPRESRPRRRQHLRRKSRDTPPQPAGVLCCTPQKIELTGIIPADCRRNISNRYPQNLEIPKGNLDLAEKDGVQ